MTEGISYSLLCTINYNSLQEELWKLHENFQKFDLVQWAKVSTLGLSCHSEAFKSTFKRSQLFFFSVPLVSQHLVISILRLVRLMPPLLSSPLLSSPLISRALPLYVSFFLLVSAEVSLSNDVVFVSQGHALCLNADFESQWNSSSTPRQARHPW